VKKRYWLFYVVLSCLLICALCGGFLFGTTSGAKLLIAQAARLSDAGIEYDKIAGQIGHDLSIEGLRVRLQGITLRIAAFRLTWQPLYLASGRLVVKTLYARDALVEDTRPDTAPFADLTWPNLPVWTGLIRGSVEQFRVERLRYHESGNEPVDLQSVSSPILWENGALLLERLDVGTSSGIIKGSLAIGLTKPALRARLVAIPKENLAPIDRLSLEAELPSARGSQQVSGKVSVVAFQGAKEWLRLDSQVAISPHAIDFKDLSLRKAELQGSISASGKLDFSRAEPTVDLYAQVNNIDLSKEIKSSLTVSGIIRIASNFQSYRGDFDLRSSGARWKEARWAGNVEGTVDQARIRLLKGSLLDGQIEGEFLVGMAEKFSLEGTMQGRNLNPAVIRPDLSGEVNVKVGLKLQESRTTGINGDLDVELLGSRFLGRPLTGKLAASLNRDLLKVAVCEVHGNGFDLSARGVLQDRLVYEIRVRDLSGLIPEARGRVSGSGWIRWGGGTPAGMLKAGGTMLSLDQVSARAVDLDIHMEKGPEGPIEATAKVQGLTYADFSINGGSAELRGTARDHTFLFNASWRAGSLAAQGQGSYNAKTWRGTLARFDCRSSTLAPWKLQQDVSLLISPDRFLITPFVLTTPQGEQIDLAADLTLSPRKGFVTASWRNLDLSRANPLLSEQMASGQSSGGIKTEWSDGGLVRVAGSLAAGGTLTKGALKLEIDQAQLNIDWNERGLLSSFDAYARGGGRLHGTLSSREPCRAALPGQATFQSAWEGIDLAVLKPFLPSQVALSGLVSGKASGELFPEKRIDVEGEAAVSQGKLDWRTSEGLMTTAIQTANITWAWRDAALRGKADLVLTDYGHVNASFRLPVMARFPTEVDKSAPLQASASGELREKGVLGALFPGLIQESTGVISFDVAANGTWAAPALRGKVRLSGAGAYLPAAGIHLQDAGAEALITDDQIRITSFTVRSGPGSLKGSATMSLKDGRIDHLNGTLTGQRFQAIYLPELQALIEPDLRFEGKGKSLSVQGSVRVPELGIFLPEKGAVRTSPDVILTDEAAKSKTTESMELTSEVRIILGNKVTVRAMGINARLEGDILVKTKGLQDVTAQGEIRIPEGQYSASGVKLDVTRGTITFNGGPPERAVLDVLALRKLPPTSMVKEVKAGVIITGSIQSPAVKLYSDPVMADADVLSYILIGRPRSTDTDQASALAQAAAALAAAGPSSKLEEGIMSRIGLDSVDVGSPQGDSKQTSVSLGKYLSPRLYVGLGYSLFRQASFLTARYSFSKNWEVESQSGNQLAADLYYKIEFN